MDAGVSVRTLASPGFVLALVVLILNDHVLKQASPGVLTGKLSDVAGLVVAPLLLGVLLTAWRVRRPMPVAIALTGVGFTLTKAWVAGATVASAAWSLTGVPTVIRADVTDLLALPALYAAWLVHRQTSRRPPTDWRSTLAAATGTAMVPVAVLATAATDCAPLDYGVDNLVVARGDFAGPPDRPETRVLFGYRTSVDKLGAVVVLPEYDRTRIAAGGDQGDGTRTCDGDGACWRAGYSGSLTVESSLDNGLTWQPEYELSQAEADRAVEGLKGGCGSDPTARFDELAIIGAGERTVVVVAADAGGLLIRDRAGDWRLLTDEDLGDLDRFPDPEPTPIEGLITPVPSRPTEDETPGATCDAPVTQSVTPNPQNGPPTSYTYCP